MLQTTRAVVRDRIEGVVRAIQAAAALPTIRANTQTAAGATLWTEICTRADAALPLTVWCRCWPMGLVHKLTG